MIIDQTKHKTEKQQEKLRKFKEEWSRIEGEISILEQEKKTLKRWWKEQNCDLKCGDKVQLYRLDKERNFIPYKKCYYNHMKNVRRDGTLVFSFRDILKDGSMGKRERCYPFDKLKLIDS